MARKGSKKRNIYRQRRTTSYYSRARRYYFSNNYTYKKRQPLSFAKRYHVINTYLPRARKKIFKIQNKNRQRSKSSYKFRNNQKTYSLTDLRLKTCQNRNTRKQVLHALNKTGKGSGNASPKFTQLSKIKC
jgi:hypothetical protein